MAPPSSASSTTPEQRSSSRASSSAKRPSHGWPSPGTPRNSVSLLICSTASSKAGPSPGRACRMRMSSVMAVIPFGPPARLSRRDAASIPQSRTAGRANNFDALRLVAALSVMFSHSFLIAEGSEASEPFVRLSGNQCVLGLVGVFVFFVISGYLVTASYCRHPDPTRFARHRILRIYPGLIVNLLVCAFVLGPLVTSLPLHGYFGSAKLYDYLGQYVVLTPRSPALPGVTF